MRAELLDYDLLTEFRRQLYKDCLTVEHLSGKQKYFRKIVFPDGGVDDNANLWGYVFEKDNVSYVLPATYQSQDGTTKERVLSETLPVLTKNAEKIAVSGGEVYWWLTKPISARVKPERCYSLKELVAFFTSPEHENKPHQRLYTLILLAQYFARANFAISTPAGFGKDSGVEILNHFVTGCNIVENPSLAKLYFLCAHSKILAYNEILSTSSDLKRANEALLLAAGANKPVLTKRSRATEGVSETIDISKLSLLLLYNDIDHYPITYKYFDQSTPTAVLDRFPRLRLYGRFVHKFTKHTEPSKIVTLNYQTYVDILKSLLWYKQSYLHEYHSFNKDKLAHTGYRWDGHLQTLLTVIDAACNTQEEFDKDIKVINDAMVDYQLQLQFNHAAERFYMQLGVTRDVFKEFESFRASVDYFKAHKMDKALSAVQRVISANTYKEKLMLLQNHEQNNTALESIESFL